jgi:hypothetical protein
MQIANSGAFNHFTKRVHTGAETLAERARLKKASQQQDPAETHRIEQGSPPAPALAPIESTAVPLATAAMDESLIRGRLADNESSYASHQQAIAQYSQVAAQSSEPKTEVEVMGIDVYA